MKDLDKYLNDKKVEKDNKVKTNWKWNPIEKLDVKNDVKNDINNDVKNYVKNDVKTTSTIT